MSDFPKLATPIGLKDTLPPLVPESEPTFGDRLQAEAALLMSVPSQFKVGLADAWDEYKQGDRPLFEFSKGLLVCAGLSYFSRRPGWFGSQAALNGKWLPVLALADLGFRLLPSVGKVWDDPSSLPSAKAELGSQLGFMALDYPTMALGGLAGAGAGRFLASQAAQRAAMRAAALPAEIAAEQLLLPGMTIPPVQAMRPPSLLAAEVQLAPSAPPAISSRFSPLELARKAGQHVVQGLRDIRLEVTPRPALPKAPVLMLAPMGFDASRILNHVLEEG